MPLPNFHYLKAKSVSEVCILLGKHQGRARVIAGGTDLLVKMKEGGLRPRYLIGLKGIPGLDGLAYDRQGLHIGAMATHRDVLKSSIVRERYGSLAEALECIGTPQIRNLGTVGGNLCNSSPAADAAPILIVLGARVKLAGITGAREMLLEDFFRGPGQTALSQGEILTEILVPRISAHSAGKYEKLALRSSADLAAVGVACWARCNPDNGVLEDIRIALGAVAPAPMRSKEAEGILRGKVPAEELIRLAASRASEEAKPVTDLRASAGYRREMVAVMARRAIKGALSMA